MGKHLDATVVEKVKMAVPWVPFAIPCTDNIPTGDMPGDKVMIGKDHIAKANLLFPGLLDLLLSVLHPNHKAVVAVYGVSGVGKSEIASLLSYYLNRMDVGAYTLSGDNYPYRIPDCNDRERMRVFRYSGIHGLIEHGLYDSACRDILTKLQADEEDCNSEKIAKYPWLSVYQQEGDNGLRGYLGTHNEIDFSELNSIIAGFKSGVSGLLLKRMGRSETSIWYEKVDFSRTNVLIIEWTHGNSFHMQGVDIPILLYSTPEETLAHRIARGRDKGADRPFTGRVLRLEAELLDSQASKVKLIVSKDGQLMNYDQLIELIVSQKNRRPGHECL